MASTGSNRVELPPAYESPAVHLVRDDVAPTLAIVSRRSAALPEPLVSEVRAHGLRPIHCSAVDAPHAEDAAAWMLAAETDGEALPLLLELRRRPATALQPILVVVRRVSQHRFLSDLWRHYADVVLDGDTHPGAALERLGQIHARNAELPPLDGPEPLRRRLVLLRWLWTRQLDAYQPLRDATARGAWALPPHDLDRDPVGDLDALARGGLFARAAVDRLCLCPVCDDARLLFREVCGGCRSTEVRRGEVVHHYACGHVQAEAAFRRGAQLVCPSCGESLRHVGIDYERPASLLHCHACDHTAAEGATEARCLGCGATPLAGDVKERAVHRYALTRAGAAAAQQASLPAPLVTDE